MYDEISSYLYVFAPIITWIISTNIYSEKGVHYNKLTFRFFIIFKINFKGISTIKWNWFTGSTVVSQKSIN